MLKPRSIVPAVLIVLIIVALFTARNAVGCLISSTEQPTRSTVWKVEKLQAKVHHLQRQVRQPLTRVSRDIRLVPPSKRAGKLRYWLRQRARIRHYHATVPEYPWGRLAECESNRRWQYDGRSGFDGGLQFHPGTWTAFKPKGYPLYPRYAHQASPRMQVLAAERVLEVQGWRAWPACSLHLGFR